LSGPRCSRSGRGAGAYDRRHPRCRPTGSARRVTRRSSAGPIRRRPRRCATASRRATPGRRRRTASTRGCSSSPRPRGTSLGEAPCSTLPTTARKPIACSRGGDGSPGLTAADDLRPWRRAGSGCNDRGSGSTLGAAVPRATLDSAVPSRYGRGVVTTVLHAGCQAPPQPLLCFLRPLVVARARTLSPGSSAASRRA